MSKKRRYTDLKIVTQGEVPTFERFLRTSKKLKVVSEGGDKETGEVEIEFAFVNETQTFAFGKYGDSFYIRGDIDGCSGKIQERELPLLEELLDDYEEITGNWPGEMHSGRPPKIVVSYRLGAHE